MCSHLFGRNSGGILGGIGDVLGGIAGFALGGPVGAALGAEAGGTLGGVAGGEKIGQAALTALPGAALGGVGGYAAEALGGATPLTGTDLLGISGTTPIGGAGGVAGAGDFSGSWDPNAVTVASDGGGGTMAAPASAVPAATSPLASMTNADGTLFTPPVPPGTPTTVAAGDVGGTGTGGQSGGGGVLSSIASTLGIPQSTIVPAGVAGLGLARDLLAPQTLKGQAPLNTIGANTLAQSEVMQNYLNTGTLPPGVQTAIDNATKGAQAAIRGKYASLGLSGSSMEQQDLANAQLQAVGAGAQVAMNLYSQGLADAQISEGVYNTLLSTDVKQQQATGNAIANLAAALSGAPAYTRTQQQQQTQPVVG